VRQQQESLRVKKEGLSALQGDELATIKLLKEIRQEEESIKIEEQWFLRQIETKRANHVKKVYTDVLSTVADIGQRNRMSAIFLVQKGRSRGRPATRSRRTSSYARCSGTIRDSTSPLR
jgi:hypothetical protein